jgi:hypothetical protein
LFSSFWNTGRWTKSENPIILSDIQCRQNTSESISCPGKFLSNFQGRTTTIALMTLILSSASNSCICHVPSSAPLCEILRNFSGKSDMKIHNRVMQTRISGKMFFTSLRMNGQHLYKCVTIPGLVLSASASGKYRVNFCRNARSSRKRSFFDVIQNTRRYFRT